MIGGAADLVESTKTDIKGGGCLRRDARRAQHPLRRPRARDGRDRERARLHGGVVKPYGATFLIFSDYMRPAVRLSALMGLPVVWVWTHDSIGLGEDGPTHQPVEHLMALRAIPNLWCPPARRERDGDAPGASRWSAPTGPVALVLTRQKVPTSTARGRAADGAERGAYVLWQRVRASRTRS